jgi:hypothetical protein
MCAFRSEFGKLDGSKKQYTRILISYIPMLKNPVVLFEKKKKIVRSFMLQMQNTNFFIF